jgi:hypothetical protein
MDRLGLNPALYSESVMTKRDEMQVIYWIQKKCNERVDERYGFE